MGEVYRARDSRLNRTVAIKVLPADLSRDPERRQRFEREARIISSLNHPHICTLHDVGNQNGIDYLVMEYLDGETLASRLAKGALSTDQVLRYAIEIADALDRAHRQGVVHRDLKPGNIMLASSGLKLLDFGLAKLRESHPVPVDSSTVATGHAPLTAHGAILGTIQYMAPEQLEQKETDTRADIFAFGAVVYEMATGRKAFEGESQASLIAAILDSDPPSMSTLRPTTPPVLDHVVSRCLAKDPEERWSTAHDVMLQLKWIADGASQGILSAPALARGKNREFLGWVAASLLLLSLLAALALGIVHFRETREQMNPVRFVVLPPEKVTSRWSDVPVISPDGQKIVSGGLTVEGKDMLWVRPLDSLTTEPLSGTEGASFPFWSPNSDSIAFFAQGKLKKIDTSGGTPQTVCDAPNCLGGTWNRDGVIVFGTWAGPLYRVSAGGGEAIPLTTVDKTRQESSHRWPQFLPDGRHFLFFARSVQPEKNGIYIGALDSKETRFVLNVDSNARYAPPGYLLFARGATLMAQPFDVRKLQIAAEPIYVAEPVGRLELGSGAAFSVSDNGALAYQESSGATVQLAWFSREGKRLGSIGDPGLYRQIVLSPDEKRVAVERFDVKTRSANIWFLELSSGILSRMTFNPAGDADPVWSPDGRRLAFTSNRKGKFDLLMKVVGSSDQEVLLESNDNKFPEDWSKDGRFLVYGHQQGRAVSALPLFGDRKAKLLVQAGSEKDEFHFSPNGRWIAYGSSESGRWEVYIASFPAFEAKRQVSRAGGSQAIWRKDGNELFYLSLDGKLMAVEIKSDSPLETGVPKVLFQTSLRTNPVLDQYCAAGNGARFLVMEPKEETARRFNVVLNWTAALKR
jgi:serine/threonine protein kinase/Tol biopolymer transport system component